MFKTNLKIAWRNLVKDRQFTFLNVFGLAIGLACALLIYLWVQDELGMDSFLADKDRVVQLMEYNNASGRKYLQDESSGLLSEAIAQKYQEVAYASPLAPPSWFPANTLSVGDKNLKASGQYAGKDYFNIFSFALLDGKRDQLLASKTSIVISDDLATRLFGTTQNLIGKAIRFEQDTTFYVSGIFTKLPRQSSQQFDFVLSFEYFKTIKPWVNTWNNLGPHNFVKLKQGADLEQFDSKIKDFIKDSQGDTSRRVAATLFASNYLHNNFGYNAGGAGRMEYVQLFSLTAIFILVIACINFMNLSTAKASRRMKEVGIKKVVGAGRKQLIVQFLAESVLITMVAMFFAILLVGLLIPGFNQLTGKQISLSPDPKAIASVLVIGLVTGLLAGSYPALYLSRFNPLTILKGKLNTSFAELFSRKGLVVFQFTLSTILIVAVMIIYQQVQLIRNTNPGYNKDNVLKITAEGAIAGNETGFINQLKSIPGIVQASYTQANIIGHSYAHANIDWAGRDENNLFYFEAFEGGYDFVPTLGMQIQKGRNFSKDFGADTANIILNETAVRAMGLKDPVGKTIEFFGAPSQIIGIVKDFHFESLHKSVKPAYIAYKPHGGKIIARINQNNQSATINAIREVYKRFNPGFTFTYSFLDEAYQQQYDSETRVAALSKYFAGLAIIISCLGLFGLAAFTAQKRQKEIGVRKVIGASVVSITRMLSVDFLKLVIISLLIAFPVAGWLMSSWLERFAYRIEIGLPVFLLAGIAVILLTILTICYQSIKAALANPVRSLRAE